MEVWGGIARAEGWLVRALMVLLILELCGCASQLQQPSRLEGASNQRSAAETAEVEAVLTSRKVQPIPKTLDGCWKGEVTRADSVRFLAGVPNNLLNVECCVPVAYDLCFDLPSGHATFAASNLRYRVVSQWIATELVPIDSHTDVLFSTGDDFVILHSMSHLRVRGKIGLTVLSGTVSSSTRSEPTILRPASSTWRARSRIAARAPRACNATGRRGLNQPGTASSADK